MDNLSGSYIDQLFKINKLYEAGEIDKDKYEFEKENLEAKRENKRYVVIYDTLDRGIKLKSDISADEIVVGKSFKESKRIFADKTLARFFNTDYYFDGKPGFEIRIEKPGIYYYNLAVVVKQLKPIEKNLFFYFKNVLASTVFKFVFFGGLMFAVAAQCIKENARENDNPKHKIERHFSNFDGSYIKFREYIKSNLKNPSSFKHVETRYSENGDGTVSVLMKYTATNSFGGVVTEIAKCRLNVNTGDFSDVVVEE